MPEFYWEPTMVRDQILDAYASCRDWRIFQSASNLEKLKRGKSATIQAGDCAGQIMEFDHRLPVSRVPELANSFGNLKAVPMSLNRAKGVKINEDSLAAAGAFTTMGWKPLPDSTLENSLSKGLRASTAAERSPAGSGTTTGGSKALNSGGKAGKLSKAWGVAGTLGGAVQIYDGVQDFKEGRTGEGVVSTAGGTANAIAAAAAFAGREALADTVGPVGPALDGAHDLYVGVRDGNREKIASGGLKSAAALTMGGGVVTGQPEVVIGGAVAYVIAVAGDLVFGD